MFREEICITKKFEFSASHRYWRNEWSKQKNEEIFGLCTSPYGHGHNYELHVTIKGKIDPETGMIINLTSLKKHVTVVLKKFDHKFLNMDTPFFETRIPTTENVALVLFEQIKKVPSYFIKSVCTKNQIFMWISLGITHELCLDDT